MHTWTTGVRQCRHRLRYLKTLEKTKDSLGDKFMTKRASLDTKSRCPHLLMQLCSSRRGTGLLFSSAWFCSRPLNGIQDRLGVLST